MVTLINHGRFLFHLILSIFRIASPAYWNQPRLEQISESFVSNFKHSLDHLKLFTFNFKDAKNKIFALGSHLSYFCRENEKNDFGLGF